MEGFGTTTKNKDMKSFGQYHMSGKNREFSSRQSEGLLRRLWTLEMWLGGERPWDLKAVFR